MVFDYRHPPTQRRGSFVLITDAPCLFAVSELKPGAQHRNLFAVLTMIFKHKRGIASRCVCVCANGLCLVGQANLTTCVLVNSRRHNSVTVYVFAQHRNVAAALPHSRRKRRANPACLNGCVILIAL